MNGGYVKMQCVVNKPVNPEEIAYIGNYKNVYDALNNGKFVVIDITIISNNETGRIINTCESLYQEEFKYWLLLVSDIETTPITIYENGEAYYGAL